MSDLHQYGQAYIPLWAILFAAYSVLLLAGVIAWGRRPKPSAAERAADDAEEMAALAAHAQLREQSDALRTLHAHQAPRHYLRVGGDA